ncbi:carbohydrate kinase family protein [Neobittarella massiliensis]|uniref:carbohydrate kinase family protein n=1 Tax=Neobittarella massiliensis (ex Bilen et al. 2018) TaxID=2041842 RepID=UPI000CF6CB0E|nr:carbohydrate kinase family protein [Neobittarella massiliensis]
MAGQIDIVVAGNITIDDMVLPDGRTQMAVTGGDVLYAALAARLWGGSVGMLSRIGSDFPEENLQRCAAQGLDITGMVRCVGPSIRNWIVYEYDGRRTFIDRVEGRMAALSPGWDDVPDQYRRAGAVFLAAMCIESQLELAQNFKAAGATVLLDPYEQDASDKRELVYRALAHTDIFLPSEEEVHRLTGQNAPDFEAAARHFADYGPHTVVIKLGDRGALIYQKRGDRIAYLPCVERVQVVDVTGAGDSFGGGFTAGWQQTGSAAEAALRGTVSSSIAIEAFGSVPLLQATGEQAAQRLAALRRQIQKTGA